MKHNFFSGASFVILVIALVAYILPFFMNITFPNTFSILLLWLFPLIGIICGFLGKRGFFKISGLIGNFLILTLTVVIPLISSFFWNEP